MRPRGLVIAIDGPSGAGKSTAGKALAAALGYTFIDTGAMYRALALKAMRARLSLDDGEGLTVLLRDTRIDLVDGGRGVLLDGDDATAAVRAREVSAAASRVSAHSPVRREMVARQRALGQEGGVVLDGRDIGTAVFPDADVKFYVDAEPRRRALRRQQELGAAGVESDLETVEAEIRERDRLDSTRTDSPLTRAPGSVHVDTTALTLEEVVARLLAAVGSIGGAPRSSAASLPGD